MTLIVSVLTPSFASVLSDRRRTSFNPVNGEIIDFNDDETKTFVLNGTHVAGYSGPVRVGSDRIRIEDWVVQRLSGVEPEQFWEELRVGLEEVCEELGWLLPCAFTAVGFQASGEPQRVLITNSATPQGRYQATRPRYAWNFEIHRQELDRADFLVESVGVALTRQQRLHLQRSLRIDSTDPIRMRDSMLEVLKRVANSELGKTVSDDAIISSLPRTAVPSMGLALWLDEPSARDWATYEVSMMYRDFKGSQPMNTMLSQPARVNGGSFSILGARSIVNTADMVFLPGEDPAKVDGREILDRIFSPVMIEGRMDFRNPN
ncbi:hypothetical protein GIS00_21585 [Nakamurella sp. YIM 132087]|uniref:Uncharacterized protein n=1 Tax=Nakamurella alba TaxID=2665158 RepID=A0A7K1FTN6_9ACTN|nr:hypothetical protein [Nakamurella alba]MTD16533.1 hypothetical protein [Nakamurella alba]